MTTFEGKFRFSEVIKLHVKAKNQAEANEKLKKFNSNFWKLDDTSIEEVSDE